MRSMLYVRLRATLSRLVARFSDSNTTKRLQYLFTDRRKGGCPIVSSRRFPTNLAALGMIVCSLGLTTSIEAAVLSGSSSGYGLSTQINALGLHLNVGPLPSGVSGSSPSPYSLSNSVLNVNVIDSIPVVVSGVVGADAVNSSATSNVDGLPGIRVVDASGSIEGANIGVNTIPLLGGGITLLGINGTLESTASIVGNGNSLNANGATTIESLGLVISGITIDLSAYVGTNVAPNTEIDLAVLGIANASLILNEQIIAPDQTSIEVNAFHLSLNLLNITANVILGHSEAHVAVPEMSTVALVGGVLIPGMIYIRRSRSRSE